MTRSRLFTIVGALALVATACGAGESRKPSAVGSQLVGLFKIAAGKCDAGGKASGTYFRMVEPKGTTAKGPFVKNTDSACGDKSFTPLTPGTDGGLATGSYQPQPKPPFDAAGNGAAKALTKPQKWFAVAFSLTTNPVDPQTRKKVPAPVIRHSGGKLSGDTRAFAAAWNGQHFNQGSPKPDGSSPGNTAPVTGTYDSDTGKFTLQWASQIVSGPFNNFTGIWHLQGTFEPRS